MPLTSEEVVNALVESTDKYLEFLRGADVGVARYNVTAITKRPEIDFFENVTWNSYFCQLPAHQTIKSDSSATLLLYETPGSEIEIRILHYDRRTGGTTFASKVDIVGESGQVVIDFRWIVRRCLTWFQNHGHNLPEINQITQPELEGVLNTDELSAGQIDAVNLLLTSGLCYIWGPPGTGKTQRVLAKAVLHLVGQGKKVLILASTNLAVDNALAAFIKAGDRCPTEKVARIGIPSPEFIKDYPECCEQRAFQGEIAAIQAAIRILQEKINRLEVANRAKVEIHDIEADLIKMEHERAQAQTSLSQVEKELQKRNEVLNPLLDSLNILDREVQTNRQRVAEIAFPQLNSEINALEAEQTKVIQTIQKQEFECQNTGILARLFTDRRRMLLASISKEKEHLHAVEMTLSSKRSRRDNLAPEVSKLQTEIDEQSDAWSKTDAKISSEKHQIDELGKEWLRLQTDLTQINNAISTKNQRKQELALLVNTDEPDQQNADQTMNEWRQVIVGHQASIAKYQQDIASKSVLGMTLDSFIGMTLQDSLSIDHVFIDEAPYAPLAKTLPVLSLRCPISLLGDHRQLPPVCENPNDPHIRAYWAKSSIFLEDVYKDEWMQLYPRKSPRLTLMRSGNLKESYRFGQRLALILDTHIYGRMGLVGLADENTLVRCYNCEPKPLQSHLRRENHAEADAIMEKLQMWWDQYGPQPIRPTIAVLALYKPQTELLRSKLRQRFGGQPICDCVEVLNTHKAQGREWDWILVSMSDTGRLPWNPFFTDSNIVRNGVEIGKLVLNTTISRAKKQVRIFLDADYWRNRQPDSMLTDIAQRYLV